VGKAGSVKRWNLYEIPTPDGTRSPVVLHTQDGEGRVLLIRIDEGQALGEHQVKEAALLLVVDGEVTVDAGEQSVDAGAGSLFRFDPDERRTVRSAGGGRVLLFLAPWPGVGHYRGELDEVSASS
jgi:quercetin dioxygenase-like cupin family protein